MQPVDPEPVPAAPYPLGQMTTAELQRYKRELEHALADNGLPADAPVRGLLEARLSGVTVEESRRAELAAVRHVRGGSS